MTEDDLKRVEEALDVKLPAPFRTFMLNYPDVLVLTKTDLGNRQESISEREFLNSADSMIHLNKDVRLDDDWTVDGGPWPQKYFVIGDDECGDYYAIDLVNFDGRVYFYEHETGEFEHSANSLADFVDTLVRDVVEFNREAGH